MLRRFYRDLLRLAQVLSPEPSEPTAARAWRTAIEAFRHKRARRISDLVDLGSALGLHFDMNFREIGPDEEGGLVVVDGRAPRRRPVRPASRPRSSGRRRTTR